jgi:methionyl-tRNA synthetase
MPRIFIGVSWPYASGPQHLGHLASTYVPADEFARFHRLRGDEVLMVSGSDMHGTPILVTAEKEGSPPEAVAERFHRINREALARIGVSFDLFTTTETVLHQRTAGEVFLSLFEKGLIRRRTESLPYCPKHRRFLPDRYVVGTCPHCGFDRARGDECDHCGRPLDAKQLGSPRCAIDGTPAEFRPSEHFYLELDRSQPEVARYLEAVGEHWRPSVRNAAENFLAEGLHPTSITRDLEWGVPIPLEGYDRKRIYVWFEALIGYLSAAKEWAVRAGRPEAWHRYWDEREPARHYYFVGKDNKFHHTIVWPAMLLGMGGLHLPYDVPANEWLTLGGAKVSKSRTQERAAFLPQLLEQYPPDVLRFYVAVLAPQNHDTELDWDEFDKLRDEQLANQLGNLVQRTLVFARDHYDGRIPPAPTADVPAGGTGVVPELRAAHERITELYELVRLKEALDLTMEQVRDANRRFHEGQPWRAKEADRQRVVYESIWRVKAIATWLSPVLPFTSAEIFRMLGISDPPGAGDWDRVLEPPLAGAALGEIRPLFPRAVSEPPAASPSLRPPSGPTEPIPLAVRAGVIRSVEAHPAADKLYVMQIDVGEASPRTVVAGLRASYTPDQLLGRKVVILANLAPRTIRRMTSQGMVLAVDHGERAVLLSPPDEVAPGAFVEGRGIGDRTITYDEFTTVPLRVGRITGVAPGGERLVDVGGRTVRVPGDWPEGSLGVVRLDGTGNDHAEWLSFGEGRAPRPAEAVEPGSKVR